ncbi:MAG: trypsin-like serine protease [Kouleothrix sp.]|nr:trypsin-like serine protease [Kouleothrix sp.]
MKRRLLIGLSVLLVALVVVAPASAITGNYVKDFEHPYVGLLVGYDASGEFIGRCSGSLLSEHVFLTAGHCVEGAVSARVYFQQDAGVHYDPATELDPVTGYPDYCAAGTLGTLCATSHELYNYGYDGFVTFPNTHDVGLVILDQAIDPGEYGVLAAAGTLDGLATRRGQQELTFTVSGYGLSAKNPAHVLSFRERLMATSTLVNLRSHLTDGYNLQTSNNPGGGRGGTCNGDSGGPFFYGGTSSNLIVAVNSFGLSAQTCQGVDFAYRTDRAEVLNWILSHVPAGDTVEIAGS